MKRVVLCIGLVVCSIVSASAHSPHDDVFDVACGTASFQDSRLYALVRGVVLVSNDRGGTWKRQVNGLDHKHMLVSLEVASGGNTLFVTSLGDGVYRSQDGGASWRLVNKGLESLVVDLVIASPYRTGDAYGSDVRGGLFHTTNAGDTWEKVAGSFGKVTAIGYFSDEPGARFLGDHLGGLYRSQDGGISWEKVLQLDDSEGLTAIAVSPTSALGPVVLAGTARGRVLRSVDGGDNFESIEIPGAAQPVTSIEMSPHFGEDGIVFASVWDEGVFYSSDGGTEWEHRSHGLTRDTQAPKLGRPHFSHVEVSPDFATDRTVYLAGFDGLFQTVDSGLTWRQAETFSLNNIVGLALSPDYSDDQTVVVTTWLWGSFLSDDDGLTWLPLNKGLSEPYFRDEGLIRLFNVVFSPSYAVDKTLFTSTWYDFFKSTNGGGHWRLIPNLEAPEDVGTNYGSYIGVSPNLETDGTIYLGTKTGLILRSTDSGERFETLIKLENMIGGVAVSPAYSQDQTVFVGEKLGIHYTRDAGKTWEYAGLIDSALDFDMPISPAHPIEAYTAWKEHVLSQREKAYAIKVAISPAYARDQTLFAGTAEGLRRSSDGGRSWQRIVGSGIDDDAYIEAVAISPDFGNDATLVVSVRGHGHYRSRDGGGSFSEIGKGLTESNVLLANYVGMIPKSPSIVFSPAFATDRTLYGFSSSQLYKSVDGGTTWMATPSPVVTTSLRVGAWLQHANHRFSIRSRVKKLAALLVAIAVLGIAIAFTVRRMRRTVGG